MLTIENYLKKVLSGLWVTVTISFFLHDIWMHESPLLDKVISGKEHYIENLAKVSAFIDNIRKWKLDNLRNYLPANIIQKHQQNPNSI